MLDKVFVICFREYWGREREPDDCERKRLDGRRLGVLIASEGGAISAATQAATIDVKRRRILMTSLRNSGNPRQPPDLYFYLAFHPAHPFSLGDVIGETLRYRAYTAHSDNNSGPRIPIQDTPIISKLSIVHYNFTM